MKCKCRGCTNEAKEGSPLCVPHHTTSLATCEGCGDRTPSEGSDERGWRDYDSCTSMTSGISYCPECRANPEHQEWCCVNCEKLEPGLAKPKGWLEDDDHRGWKCFCSQSCKDKWYMQVCKSAMAHGGEF